MQKVILLLMVSTMVYCQNQEHYLGFSTGIDIRNITTGTPPTNGKPALDLLYQFSIVSHNFEVNIGYENFNKIGFDKYTIGIAYHFPLYAYAFGKEIKTVLVPSIEPTIIDRWGSQWNTTSSHLSIGGNIGLRWHLNDKIMLELLTNFLPRTDLFTRYPELHKRVPIIESNYLKLIYKL